MQKDPSSRRPATTGRDRNRLLALGLVLFALGTLGLAAAWFFLPEELFDTGLLLTAGGAAQLLAAMGRRGRPEARRQVATGLLYLTAGLAAVFALTLASPLTTLVIVGCLIVVGTLRIETARQHQGLVNREWILIGGIAAILLGMMIGIGWPVAGSHATGLMLSSELIFNAWTCLILAQGSRSD